jgi:hypothetical protein
MEVQPPIQTDGFFIFNDAIPENIQTVGCASAITGECVKTNNVKDCIEQCKSSEFCSMGYFIDTFDKKICVPLRSSLPNTTVYYNRIKHKSIYPKLNTAKTTVFVKSLGSSFPPNRSNIVFYADSLGLQAVDSKLYLTDVKNVSLGGSPLYMDILPYRFDIGKKERNYVPVENYDNVMFNIRGTSLLLTISTENKLVWEKGNINDFDVRRTFHLNRTDTSKKVEPFYYGSKFYITYYDKIIRVVDGKISIEKDSGEGKRDLFTFVPNVEVYYKSEKNGKVKCNKVNLKDTNMNGIESKYENNITYRNKTCWILKNPNPPKQRFIDYRYIKYMILILLICLIYYLKT